MSNARSRAGRRSLDDHIVAGVGHLEDLEIVVEGEALDARDVVERGGVEFLEFSGAEVGAAEDRGAAQVLQPEDRRMVVLDVLGVENQRHADALVGTRSSKRRRRGRGPCGCDGEDSFRGHD